MARAIQKFFIIMLGGIVVFDSEGKKIGELVSAWDTFFKSSHWESLVEGYEPIESTCGRIYELPNYLNRVNENLAIVDMRHIPFSEPHYHVETEVYFMLQGSGVIVVGYEQQDVKQGDTIVIPSNIAHFVIPDNECVIAVVSTPPFNPDHYKIVTENDDLVKFDKTQFLKFTENHECLR